MNTDAKRRDYVAQLVMLTRAALVQWRDSVNQSVAEAMPRLDELQAWAEQRAELPKWAIDYAAAASRIGDDLDRYAKPRARDRKITNTIDGTGGLLWCVADAACIAAGALDGGWDITPAIKRVEIAAGGVPSDVGAAIAAARKALGGRFRRASHRSTTLRAA